MFTKQLYCTTYQLIKTASHYGHWAAVLHKSNWIFFSTTFSSLSFCLVNGFTAKPMHIHFTGSLEIVGKWAKGGAGLVCWVAGNNKPQERLLWRWEQLCLCKACWKHISHLQEKILHSMCWRLQNEFVWSLTQFPVSWIALKTQPWRCLWAQEDEHDFIATFPASPGEDLDSRHTLGCFLL